MRVKPYQTFNAFMECLICFFRMFDTFIKRSMETLKSLSNSTIKRLMLYIKRSMNQKTQQFLTRCSNSINKTHTAPFYYSLVPWSSKNVCDEECLEKEKIVELWRYLS
jgi:hypothetical protein